MILLGDRLQRNRLQTNGALCWERRSPAPVRVHRAPAANPDPILSLIRVNYGDARDLAREDHSSSSQAFCRDRRVFMGWNPLLSQHICGDKNSRLRMRPIGANGCGISALRAVGICGVADISPPSDPPQDAFQLAHLPGVIRRATELDRVNPSPSAGMATNVWGRQSNVMLSERATARASGD